MSLFTGLQAASAAGHLDLFSQATGAGCFFFYFLDLLGRVNTFPSLQVAHSLGARPRLPSAFTPIASTLRSVVRGIVRYRRRSLISSSRCNSSPHVLSLRGRQLDKFL